MPLQHPRIGGCIAFVLVLTLLFMSPLTRLILYAANSDLHSHILLVPLVVGYLLFVRRKPPLSEFRTSITGVAATAGIGLAALTAEIAWRESVSVNDDLALMAVGYVSLVAAGGFLFLGSRWMSAASFPVGFLIFMVPLPDAAVDWLKTASVAASAEVAAVSFKVAGTMVARHGTVFELPGILLQVGEACSGVHSSWVLFVTSILASHLFLKTRWRQAVLIAFVIPLAILRNGLRIVVIGLLCVHVGPHMIDSAIHRRGGPVFFALSLVPLFLMMTWLRRQERRLNLGPPSGAKSNRPGTSSVLASTSISS